MSRRKLFFAFVIALNACSSSEDIKCKINDDCIDGYLCAGGECRRSAPVSIRTEKLPDAVVGKDYSFQLEAADGVAPYTWQILQGPGWLSVASSTGKLSGTPPTYGTAIPVRIKVEDSTSGRDSSAEKEFSLNVLECQPGEERGCFTVQDGKCFGGSSNCQDGRFASCLPEDFSDDINFCGPQCSACPLDLADSCRQGLCACGQSSLCAPGQLCCGDCVDPLTDDHNCGGCGLSCAADNAKTECRQGGCVFVSCNEGWGDCNNDLGDGCEQALDDVENCGACAKVCSPPNALPDCSSRSCQISQCKEGWADCDDMLDNGCEISTASDSRNCGACGQSCSEQTRCQNQTCAPCLGGRTIMPELFTSLAIKGTYLYAAGTKFAVFNVENPQLPVKIGEVSISGAAYDIFTMNDLAFIAAEGAGLLIADISQPSSPRMIGSYDTLGQARGVWVKENMAYVADGDHGLQIIDVSNPSAPLLRGQYWQIDEALAVMVEGHLAYIAASWAGLIIVDVSDPASPKMVSLTSLNGQALRLLKMGTHVFVAARDAGLQVLDVSQPEAPQVVSQLVMENTYSLAGSGSYLFVYNFPIIWSVEISDPLQPRKLSQVPVLYSDGYTLLMIPAILADGNRLYLTNQAKKTDQQFMYLENNINIIDITDPSWPCYYQK